MSTSSRDALRSAVSLLLFVRVISNLKPPEVCLKPESLVLKSVTTEPPDVEGFFVVSTVVASVVA